MMRWWWWWYGNGDDIGEVSRVGGSKGDDNDDNSIMLTE